MSRKEAGALAKHADERRAQCGRPRQLPTLNLLAETVVSLIFRRQPQHSETLDICETFRVDRPAIQDPTFQKEVHC